MSHGIHYSSKIRPTQERVKAALSYNSETGLFRWIEPRRGRVFMSVAGHIDSSTGYRRVVLDDRSYYAAKLAWLYSFGEYPECVVDHINRVKDDDRLINLRLATQSQNMANSVMFTHNTSGTKGVYFYESRAVKGWAPWWAYINKEGKRISLGYFNSKKVAAMARQEAELELFGEFADNGNTELFGSSVCTINL